MMADRSALLLEALKSGNAEEVKELLEGEIDHPVSNDGETPLHIACRYGHTALVKILYSMSADVHKQDSNGITPVQEACKENHIDSMLALFNRVPIRDYKVSLLHYACNIGNLDAVQALLDKLANFVLAGMSLRFNSESPLHIACRNSDLRMIRLLCSRGIDMTAKDESGSTPLLLAVIERNYEVAATLIDEFKCNANLKRADGLSPLHIACCNGDLKMIRLLCDHGANLNARDEIGNTPLILSVTNRSYEVVLVLIKELKCNPNAKGRDGMSPLHIACSDGNIRMVRLLCNHGADTNASDYCGNTPLLISVKGQNYEVASALLKEFSCIPNIKNEKGMSPLRIACKNGDLMIVRLLCEHGADFHGNSGDTPLLLSVQNQHYEVVLMLIKEFKYSPNIEGINGVSPLHIACSNGDLRMVHLLCDHGADVNVRDDNGDTPFTLAFMNEKYEFAFTLLDKYSCDPNIIGSKNISPLHIACGNGDLKMVRLLCNRGADVNVKDKSDSTPLLLSVQKQYYVVALELIKEFRCNLNCCEDSKGMSPLHAACKYGDLRMVRLLCENGADVNTSDYNGNTPLLISVKKQNYEITLALVEEFKCNPNCESGNGMSPLHIACYKGDLRIVSILCDHGADVHSRNEDGNTPLLLLLMRYDIVDLLDEANCYQIKRLIHLLCDFGADVNAKGFSGNTPLLLSIIKQSYVVALVLIKEFRCDPNIEDGNGLTPLHIACSNGDIRIVHLLCDLGADVNAKGFNGHTPLSLSIKKQKYEVVSVLIEYKCDLNTKDKDSMSPLHIACSNGDIMMVCLLCDHGADVNAKNNDGDTPLAIAVTENKKKIALALVNKYKCNPSAEENKSLLHIACSNGDPMMVNLLCDHGADMNANHAGYTPLVLSLVKEQNKIASLLIEEFKCSPNTTGTNGILPLHAACRNGDLKAVCLLCDHGANVDAKDSNGDTSLAVAIREKKVEIALALLKYKCNPNIINNNGVSPLHVACTNGDTKMVRVLIKDYGADLNCRDKHQCTPLIAAVSKNHYNIMKSLIDYGCDIGVPSSGGGTLLHVAASKGSIDVLHVLLNNYGMSLSLVDKAGNTALHVAVQANKYNTVQTLLEDYNAPVYLRNGAGAIPRNLASSDLQQLFSVYMTKHHEELEADYRAMEKLASSRYSETGPHYIIRLFVLGHPGAGKSSLVETLKRERFFQSLTRVSDKSVPLHTAGIVPSVHTSTTYGRVQFYDFAGDPEYYSSHAAILERLFQSDIGTNICVIVLNLMESEAEIVNKLNYWHCFVSHNSRVLFQLPSTIVIGSHADLLSKEEILKKSKSLSIADTSDYMCLDCCNPRPWNISQLRQKLHDISKSSPVYTLSYEESLLLGLLEKDFTSVTACTAKTIVSHIQEVNLNRLPRSVSGLYTLFKKLQAIGVLFIVGDKEEDCYLVLDVAQLTNEVHRKLFAEDTENDLASFNIGLLPSYVLKGILPEYITKECLIQLQYCQVISHAEIADVENCALSTLTDESLLFFPALNKLNKSEITWLIPPEGSYSIGWLAKCTRPNDHFPPRFLHVLLLRIAVRFTLVAALDLAQESGTPHQLLKRRCQMWKTGVHWLTRKGVECEVDVDISQHVVVSVRCNENSRDCLTLFNSIISCVMEAKAEFCHSIQLKFYLLDKLHSISNDNLYELKDVKDALQKNDKMIVSVEGKTWMCCSKLVHIRNTFWDTLFSIDEHSVLTCIQTLIEWFQLGLRLHLSISTLRTIERSYPSDDDRQKVEMIVIWLNSTHSHPPCWWTLVKALREMDENRIAEDIMEHHGEHVKLQKKLIEPAYSEIKPDDEFLQSFSGVVGGKWPYLASLLSLNSSVIQEIRAEGEGRSQRDQAYLMLQRWSSRDGATYSQLQPIALFTLFSLDL